MPTTVEVRFAALPGHVRTARLIAAAVARRAGVDEALLDEVRLAVGEACSRAVRLHQLHDPTGLVALVLASEPGRFVVEVVDAVPVEAGERAGDVDAGALVAAAQSQSGGSRPIGESAGVGTPEPGGAPAALADLPPGVGLAVITGLVDDVTVSHHPSGSCVRMAWPAAAVTAPGAGQSGAGVADFGR